jgi:methylglutaconyl-CoA hydratase
VREIPEYETIRFTVSGGIGRLVMDRPYVHNAFNADMISDMLHLMRIIKDMTPELRVVVLTGEGRTFCAGADINWLAQIKDQTYEENIRESLEMSDLIYAIYSLPLITIARVNGAAFGSGVGFIAACDLAISSKKAKFAVNDVKLGLTPAVAMPYIFRKIGESYAREMLLTGEAISAERALAIGLIHDVVDASDLDNSVNLLAKRVMTSGPDAIRVTKKLAETVPVMTFSEARAYTAEILGKQRIGNEGQEGMRSFIEKRKPSWSPLGGE